MSKLGQSAGALGLALVLSSSLAPSSSAADSGDRSYLPPWMLASASQTGGTEMQSPARPAQDPAPGAEPGAATAPPSKSPDAQPAHVGAKVFGYVRSLIGKSWRYATGE